MKKYALITGATGGIGLEFARLFVADGWNIILVARNETRLTQIQHELEAEYAVTAETVCMDLAQETAAEELYRMSEERGWEVQNLVNNVGFGDHSCFFDSSWERQKNMLDINITALIHLTYLFGKAMRQRGSGRILNVSSLASLCAGPYMSVYYASKAFVRSFSEALHEELAQTGVTVTALCPGPVATGFEKNANLKDSKMFRVLPVADAAEVARAGYRAMQNGKAIVYFGTITKVFNLLSRVISRRIARRTAMRINGKV